MKKHYTTLYSISTTAYLKNKWDKFQFVVFSINTNSTWPEYTYVYANKKNLATVQP